MGKLGRTIPVAAIAATALVAPGGASAAENIGQIPTGAPRTDCAAQEAYVQQQVPAPPDYTPSAHGIVTSWSAKAGNSALGTLQFLVLRPTGATDTFTVIGKDSIKTLSTPNQVNTFSGVQFPINPSDRVGYWQPPNAASRPCAFDVTPVLPTNEFTFGAFQSEPTEGSTIIFSGTQNEFRVNLAATVEDDCDNDGLGDQTQDPNTSSCQAPPPPLPPPPAPTPSAPPSSTPPGPTPPGPAVGVATTCKGQTATIEGTSGNDVRSGTAGKDVIAGLGGSDRLSGLAGNDVICGGAGKDTLKGGKGNDKLYGQAGKDALKGGGGNDVCKGGKGKDTTSSC